MILKRRKEEFASVKGNHSTSRRTVRLRREDKSEDRDSNDKRRLSEKSREKLKNLLQ